MLFVSDQRLQSDPAPVFSTNRAVIDGSTGSLTEPFAIAQSAFAQGCPQILTTKPAR